MRLLRVVFVSFLLFSITLQNAWSADEGILTHSIKSSTFGIERNYFVKLPNTYEQGENHTYPVIYLLDGRNYLQHFHNVSDLLSTGDLTPEFILVGIEHKQRVRDLTPTSLEGRPDTGGADKFLQFIEQELMPTIEDNYPINGFNILAGHSLAGLFTVHTMHTKPTLFDAHFAFSPSLYWDNQTTIKSFKSFFQSQSKHHNFLYMNMGNEGLDDPYDNSIAMRNGYIDLVDFIAKNAPEKFRFESEHMEEEYHMSTIVAGPFFALRSLYQKYPLPTSIIKQGLGAILQHYQALSDELGIETMPTQGRLFNAGMYHLWADEDLEKGIEILKHTIGLDTSSMRSHDGLVQLYEANGQLNEALKHCATSLKQVIEPSDAYRQRCATVKQRIETNSALKGLSG